MRSTASAFCYWQQLFMPEKGTCLSALVLFFIQQVNGIMCCAYHCKMLSSSLGIPEMIFPSTQNSLR